MLKDFKALASHLAPAGEDTILTNSYQIKSNAIPNQSDSKTGQFETRAQATQQIRKTQNKSNPGKAHSGVAEHSSPQISENPPQQFNKSLQRIRSITTHTTKNGKRTHTHTYIHTHSASPAGSTIHTTLQCSCLRTTLAPPFGSNGAARRALQRSSEPN